MLGLRFCARAFSSCGERGPLFIVVRRPLTITASLVAEHRLQTRRLSSCGSRAHLLRGMWDLPRPGLEPVSPALAGGLSTTAPPGKPLWVFFDQGFLLPALLGTCRLPNSTNDLAVTSGSPGDSRLGSQTVVHLAPLTTPSPPSTLCYPGPVVPAVGLPTPAEHLLFPFSHQALTRPLSAHSKTIVTLPLTGLGLLPRVECGGPKGEALS